MYIYIHKQTDKIDKYRHMCTFNFHTCSVALHATSKYQAAQNVGQDTLLLGLVYPEKPLCTSKTLQLSG